MMSYTLTKLAEIAEGMGLPFIVETWSRANLIADYLKRKGGEEPQLPFVVAIQPIRGVIAIDQFDQWADVPSVYVGFADRMPLDFKGREAEEIAERLKALAVKFIARVNNSGYFTPVSGEVSYDVSFDRLDANLLIFSMELPLRPVVGACLVD